MDRSSVCCTPGASESEGENMTNVAPPHYCRLCGRPEHGTLTCAFALNNPNVAYFGGDDREGDHMTSPSELIAQVKKPDPPEELCEAYAEAWEYLEEPPGWLSCSLLKGHEGNHRYVKVDA